MTTSLEVHTSDIRVRDYLNDKFQTLSDLSTLDTLLTSVQTQQQQLRSQLIDAERDADATRAALDSHSKLLKSSAQTFRDTQADIDRRLLATASTDAASDAADVFTAAMEKLRRTQVAKGYVALLQEVQELAKEAREKVELNDPKAALVPYTKLQTLATSLKKRNDAAEGAAVHLVEYVGRSRDELWEDMKGRLSGGLKNVLDAIGWPKENLSVQGKEKALLEAFERLLALQGPELDAGNFERPLLPFSVLVKPLALRFRYHFEGDRQTNRIDKPEWFLSHLTGLVMTYSSFLTDYIQPILSVSSHPQVNDRDAIAEFITALLPILRRKTSSLLPELQGEAQYLSHFVHEMLKFDAELREEFYYAPYNSIGPWKGITHEVLVVQNGFSSWLRVEKEFALSRYHTILAADDAWAIDYDSVDPAECKPTKSALRLKDLLESVTDSYRPLISFSQRLRFLIDIQIAILDQYHDRLSSSIEAFRVLSSSIARAVQGTSKEEVASLSGLGGLERLCKVYGSSAFLESCMRDWGEDVFFLELWEDLSSRAASASPNRTLAGEMNVRDVASVTSSAVVSGDDDGALFDETAGAYRGLRERTEDMMIELVSSSLKDELKAYARITLWASPADSSTTAASTSPELVAPLTTLSQHLAFLTRALSPAVAKRVYRAVAAALQAHIFDSVILRNQFSLAGGRQLERDMREIWELAGIDGAERYWPRVREAVVLLTLEADALREESKGIFEGGEKARGVLKKLGIENLNVTDARGIVQRRVEAWG